jgi:hypothetical protein
LPFLQITALAFLVGRTAAFSIHTSKAAAKKIQGKAKA